MNTSLLVTIGVAVVVVCFLLLLLLRKSSKKEVPPTSESLQGPAPESVGEKEEADTDLASLLADEPLAKGEGEEEVEILAGPSPEEQFADAITDEESFVEILSLDEEMEDGEESFIDILEEDTAEAGDQVEEILSFEDEERLEIIPDEDAGAVADKEPAVEIIGRPGPGAADVRKFAARAASSADEAAVVPTLTIDVYETRLRKREKEQQQTLAEAIGNGDDIQRDHLQIELVAITDLIALLGDSYKQELEWRKAGLEALAEMGDAIDTTIRERIRESLLCGETEPAEEFFAGIVDKQGEKAPLAAFVAGCLAEARVDLYLALERYRKAVDLDGDNCDYLRAAGVMARRLYRYRDARPLLEKLVELLAQKDKDSVDLALARRELAYAYALSGSMKQAGPLYKQAMKTIAARLGPEHREMGVSWSQIAELQEAKGQYEQAASTYDKALAIMEKELGPEHPALDNVLEKLAGINVEFEEDNKAAALYERLCAIREKSLGSTHPKLAMALQNLAESYRLQGKYDKSEESYRKALAILEKNHGENHPAVAAVLQELAKLCSRQKKNDEAERLQQRASAIFEESMHL